MVKVDGQRSPVVEQSRKSLFCPIFGVLKVGRGVSCES